MTIYFIVCLLLKVITSDASIIQFAERLMTDLRVSFGGVSPRLEHEKQLGSLNRTIIGLRSVFRSAHDRLTCSVTDTDLYMVTEL